MSKIPKIINLLLILGISLSIFSYFYVAIPSIEADSNKNLNLNLEDNLLITQKNSLISPSNLSEPAIVVKKIKVVITGYSSSFDETDETPFLTAHGTKTRDGIIANNLLPFDTKIRIPELYGDKIFVIEDRMNWQKSYYHIDIWFPSKEEAKNFGAKIAYIEILED